MIQELQRLIDSGQNLLVVGRAGTGKTWLLKGLLELNKCRAICVTAPTGMAAINCEGQTLHGAFHFPVRMSLLEPSVIKKRDTWFTQLAETNPSWNLELLFIDEISMVRADVFDALEKVLRTHGPKKGAPFGGVQIVLFGDPLQLPPIVKRRDVPWFNTPTRWNSEWFFSTRAYRKSRFHFHHLRKNYRQTDPLFAELLGRVRLGEANAEDLAFLRSLSTTGAFPPNALHLYCRKKPAVIHNETKLGSLAGPPVTFIADSYRWNGDPPVEDTINLKQGAQVMLRANLSVGDGWVNGTLATVVDIDVDTKHVYLKRGDGATIPVGRFTWTHEMPKRRGETWREKATFSQIPIELAWAFTIHKMQGQTVDNSVVLHPENPFDFGQLYVGLSRVRSAHQLFLTNHPQTHYLRPNWKALNFLRNHDKLL